MGTGLLTVPGTRDDIDAPHVLVTHASVSCPAVIRELATARRDDPGRGAFWGPCLLVDCPSVYEHPRH